MPQKEIRDIERDKASGVTIEVQGNSLQKLVGCLKGAGGGSHAQWEAGPAAAPPATRLAASRTGAAAAAAPTAALGRAALRCRRAA